MNRARGPFTAKRADSEIDVCEPEMVRRHEVVREPAGYDVANRELDGLKAVASAGPQGQATRQQVVHDARDVLERRP